MQQTVFVIGATYGEIGDKLKIVQDYIMGKYEILRVYTMDGKANGTVPLYANNSICLSSFMNENNCKEVIVIVKRIVATTKLENGENFLTLLVQIEI